ncbi:sulfatase-like hydrolase/transferase [Flammeovirga sp. OC4]|uniref:sulfatase-like hydrolase/transferase n=1 Tax=Flammeovirga sp. OC4 TaxID=1382345 RepID=UPI0006934B35|nr:sulfatase-like hydrolase/transferase [Flammeovirga sp. OC4]
MKKFISYLSVGILLFSSCQKTQKETSKVKEEKLPNVVIFLADDAGYADFGFQGSKNIPTPHLDNLASGGVVFTDAHTTCSVCSPSRAGLLTGRYQHRFGHENNFLYGKFGMDTTEVTMADVLKTKGYNTALFGKWHLGTQDYFHPNSRGFDEFYGFLGGHRGYFFNPDKYDAADKTSTHINHNGKHEAFEGYLTDVLADRAIDFIRDNKKSETPFLALLSFNAVHTPLQAKEEDLEKFKDHPRQKVAAMTYSLDEAIGDVMKTLKEEGLEENTIVFFFSDNGGTGNGDNSPLKANKGYEFEGGHRVPYLMYWKGQVKGGVTYDGLTSTLDVMPTILKAAGIDKTPKALDGVDLLPYVKGTKEGMPHDELYWRIGDWKAARYKNYKLVKAEGVGHVVYNLEDDISEQKVLNAELPKVEGQLLKNLTDWENDVIPAAWPGTAGWTEVKRYAYGDLFENRKPSITSPGQLKKLKTQK